jgi:hypothetical protein
MTAWITIDLTAAWAQETKAVPTRAAAGGATWWNTAPLMTGR